MTSWRYRDSRWAERLSAPIDWNSKIAPVAVVALVLAIVGSAIVIARDGAAEDIAHDARVLTWSESVSSAAVALRADVREGLIVGQSASFDLVEEGATTESVARIHQAISELDRRVNALVESDDDGGIGASAAIVAVEAASVADALAAGRIDEALTTAEGELSAAFEDLTARTTAVSQAAADDIAVANTGLGLTTAARFIAALLLPALVVFLLYRALRRSQKSSLLRSELARERELRRKKDAFVAAASHHVKTPMTAVVGFAELLRDGSGDFSGSVRDEVTALLAAEAEETSKIVDDLFAAARYDLGDFTLRAERLELRDILDSVTSDWERTHQAKMTISGNAAVLGDEQWLGHGIHNLLRLAASSGGDEIRVFIGSNQRMSTIEISDNGAAIPAEENQRISEIYYGHRQADGLAPPLGLGLSVARRIARATGGDLRYERRDGMNVFQMALPIAESPVLPKSPLDRIIDPSAGMPAAESIESVIDAGGPPVVYQPIVELSTAATEQRVVGYEALAHFPSHAPGDWFTAAARLGLNVDLELACARAAIDDFYPVAPGAFLAVNVSDETLHSSRFKELIVDVDPTSLVLELPVTASIASYQNTRELLNGLARTGVRVAIDQAGPADSSLTSITRLDVQIIKIDRSLVKGAMDSTRYRGLIRGIAAIADEIGAMAVAVGIETVEDHALLTDLGVSHGQGHFYARPGKLDKGNLVHRAG
jgi:EAL domain-containing protein (putative c-di-GMP-specific phosphodiesterase class I)/signal transduction histidine kinase